MENLFVPFILAMLAKEKGFDYKTIYAWCEKGGWNTYTRQREEITHVLRTNGNPFGNYNEGKNWNVKYERNKNKIVCSAPMYQQLVDWFREKHSIIISHDSLSTYGFSIDNPSKPGFFRIYISNFDYYRAFQDALMHAFTLI